MFHEIEAETKHGVEHHDVTYKTLPLHRKQHEISHPYHESDFARDDNPEYRHVAAGDRGVYDYTDHEVREHHSPSGHEHSESYYTHEQTHADVPLAHHVDAHHSVAHHSDRHYEEGEGPSMYAWSVHQDHHAPAHHETFAEIYERPCLLYTSDAADE